MSRIAFVSGSNGSEEFGQLKYAVSDSNAVASALASTRCQFQVIRPEQAASPYAYRETLDRAAASCKVDDTFVVYFAGHGVLDAGELFLVLDNTSSNFQTTALPAEDVLASMRRSKAQNKLLILDCCHAGGAIRYRSTGTLPVEELRIASANHLILMASGRLERVREYDQLGGGFLSQKICAALGEQFHNADTNGDLCLTIDELIDFLERSASWHNSLHTEEQVTIPHLFGEKKGNLFLTPDKTSWHPHEIQWADGTTMVVLPIPPIDLNNSETYKRWKREESQFQERTGYAFAIGKHPITNSQYRNFLEQCDANTAWTSNKLDREELIDLSPKEPQGENFDPETQRWIGSFFPWREEGFQDPLKPVVCISFNEALAYSKWAHELASLEISGTFTYVVPYQLWEFATFGVDERYSSRFNRRFRSFNDEKLTNNLAGIHHKASEPSLIDTKNQRINERGITDLLGNIWEWCGSMNGLMSRLDVGYSSRYPERISLRGGSFLDDIERINLVLSKSEIPNGENSHHSDHGFRIAALIPVELLSNDIRLQLQLFPSVDDIVDDDFSAVISEASDL